MQKLFLSLLFIFISFDAAAEALRFSNDEISQSRSSSKRIAQVAAQCLERKYKEHTDFYNEWGFSKFYGNQVPQHANRFYRLSQIQSLPQVRNMNLADQKDLVNQMEPTACIKLSMDCLEAGFKSVGMGSTWSKIYTQLAVGRNFYGTDLLKSLSGLGWKVLYWNPNLSLSHAWDQEDRRLSPMKEGDRYEPTSWGRHADFFQTVRKNGTYAGVRVNDARSLTDFGSTAPAYLQKIPFFIGVAHAGFHVFAGHEGTLIESYGARKITDRGNLQKSQFNPLSPSGGPRWSEKVRFRSGLIAVPPGF